MSDLTHLFTVGQVVKCKFDDDFCIGTVKETYQDHIIVDVPEVSDHCWFENGLNIDCVFPVYEILEKARRKRNE